MLQVAAVGPAFGQYVHFSTRAPPGQAYGVQRYGSEVLRLYDVMEHRLQASPFLGGHTYSIADVAVFPWVRTSLQVFPMFRTDAAALLWSGRPALRCWFDLIGARPAVQRGIVALAPLQSLDQAAFGSASPDELDRFFGRTPNPALLGG